MFQALIILAALGLGLAPLSASTVETYYSSGIFSALQSALTWFSNLAPFALLDVLAAGVVVWWVVSVARDIVRRRTGWLAVAARAAARTATALATMYVVFLATWGLNYRRVPLVEKVQFDPGAVSPGRARELVDSAVTELNALYDRAHAAESPSPDAIDSVLVDGFHRAEALVGLTGRTRPGRPKRTLLDLYFRSAGVDAMTDPYFLEILVASTLVPIERPFIVAHEWAHLAGVTDEGEANFVGWIACVHGDERTRYSGWLFLYAEASRGLPARDRAETAARLASGPRQDLRAISERIRRYLRPTVAMAGWRVYDRYLRANRVQAGAASYAEVVRLVLGTKFDRDWSPRLR